MTTVYDAGPVVNPVHGQLGDGMAGLYDWLRIRTRPGRTRRVDELSPPGTPRYEQLADRLRRRIFDGSWPDGASGPLLGAQYGVSQTAVQKAFEILEREGLVLMESGRRTSLSGRRWWQVEASAHAEPGVAEAAGMAVEAAMASFPAVREARAAAAGSQVMVLMIIESAHIGGAIAAALPLAELAMGGVPVGHLAAFEVAEGASVAARPA
jgi:DNA-binding transcriptional regulator YhcF (GntR family)